jgi:hypothetical protein
VGITVLSVTVNARYIFGRLTLWKQFLSLLFLVVVFQWAQYSTPELTATGMIVISIGFPVRALIHQRHKRRHMVIAGLFSVPAFCIEI